MVAPRIPLGFGTTKQTAEFLGLGQEAVLFITRSGRWRSWLINGRRLFDLDEIVKQLAQDAGVAAIEPSSKEVHTGA